MPPARADRIVLVGMMGCGKTTVGGILAKRLGWPFHDNDAMLRQLFAATPRQLLEAGGEAAMHAAELTALSAALAMPTPAVVAAAGGTILDPRGAVRGGPQRPGRLAADRSRDGGGTFGPWRPPALAG